MLVRLQRGRLKLTVNLFPAFNPSEIEEAFKRLKSRRFKKSFEETKRFAAPEERSLNSLGKYLSNTSPDQYFELLKNYTLAPYSGFKIEKSNGKPRPLLIPEPQDRILLAATFPKVKNRLSLVLKKHNALGLGLFDSDETTECKKTLLDIYSAIQNGQGRYILKLDFKDFFSSIDRPKLIKFLSPYFKTENQKKIFEIIKASIANSIDADDDFWHALKHLNLKTVGIPQGLSYSPLLASFYALSLDTIPNKVRGCIGYRYLDDMIILAPSESKAKRVYELLKKESEKLKLNLHPLEKGSKTQLIDIEKENFEFLGIGISKGGLYVPDEAVEDFKDVFRKEIVNRKTMAQFGLSEIMRVYKRYARGWSNHYSSICPKHYEIIVPSMNIFLKTYIEKLSFRKRFFGPHRLIVDGPFIELV